VTLVAVLSAVFAQRVQHGQALPRYLDERARAERLRSVYFQYVVGVDRYSGPQRRQRLREDISELMRKGVAVSRQRRAEVSDFYATYRIADQQRFYDARRAEYERADSQLAAVTTTLLLLAAAASVHGAGEIWLGRAVWGILAAACSALAATTSSWGTLIGFRENARLYRSARLALDPLLGPLEDRPDDPRGLQRVVVRAEEILQAETSQWGQHLKASAATMLPAESRTDVHGQVVELGQAGSDRAAASPPSGRPTDLDVRDS
jgi:SMODS and SLOG-associating 2TM effector domain 1